MQKIQSLSHTAEFGLKVMNPNLQISIIGCTDKVLVWDAVQVYGSFQQLLEFCKVLLIVRGRQFVRIPGHVIYSDFE